MRRPDHDPNAPKTAQNHVRTLITLLPYLWPTGQLELRVRVVIAMTLLAAAKGFNVYVPFFYKAAVDALSVEVAGVVVVPIMIIVGYGLARVMAQALGEIRDAVFAKVAQHAIRSVALRTFNHLHSLALRFHLDRQTGGLSRTIERGTKGIQFLLTFTLFNILPTLLEILLVCGILLWNYNFWFAAITFGTIVGYIAFTMIDFSF